MRRICRSDDTEEPSRETTASMAPISRALHIVPQITGAFSGRTLGSGVRLGTSRAANPGMYFILLLLLVLMVVGTVPAWPYSRGWGYYPSGGLGLLLVVLLFVAFLAPGRSWW